MRRRPASHWMQMPNYGRAIASRAARYSARYYRIIIAALVVASLVIGAIGSSSLVQGLTAGGVLLYIAYVIGRMLFVDRWASHYYRPAVQWLRALVSIFSLTILLVGYALSHQPSPFWVLYLLAVMIVSEHCTTQTLLVTLGIIAFLLLVLGYVGSGLTLAAYVRFSPSLQSAVLQILAVFLLGFLLAYLIRNVEARDTFIGRYRDMMEALADQLPSLHEPQVARQWVLNTCRTMLGASCCSFWTLDPRNGQLILSTCTREDESHPDCPIENGALLDAVLPLDDDRVPAFVARTGQPHFASRADVPPKQMGDALPAPRPFLPYARLEVGIPIPDFRPHQLASHAVLCAAFDRPMKHEEMRQQYEAVREMMRYLSPLLYYASLLEQYQALQELLQTVTNSLDRDRVLDTLLKQVTEVFGFDFATVSLVDEAENVIRTVRGCNVPDEWISAAVHSLDSQDIQADVVRTGRTEILAGWDDRFDRNIWEQFGHEDLVRVFMPITVADPITGQEKRIGTLEAGYRGGQAERITYEQVRLLEPFVAQAGIAIVNALLYEQMRSTANALTALHHDGQAIQSAVWESRRLLEQIGRSAETVLGADIVLLFEYDEARQRAELLFVGGDVWGEKGPSPQLGEGNILDAIVQERKPFYRPDVQQEPLLVGSGGAGSLHEPTFTQRQGVVSFAGVPLLSGEELLGIMCVDFRRRHLFQEREKRLIELFAQQAAVALKTARLREQDHKLTLAEARADFSRALHHSTLQDLFAVSLKASTALHYLGAQETEPAIHELHHIAEIAEGAKRQLGYLLSEFNAPDFYGQDFRFVLEERIERIRRYYDIRIEYGGDGDGDIPSHVHFALSCLAREALNNVIRHAQCQCLRVSYGISRTEIVLEIADDGVGFDKERALRKKDKMGLRNMYDYARSIGATLELESSTNQGTRVTVRVPLQDDKRGGL